MVIRNTLLMMNAATNAVMKAKISSPVPKIEMIEFDRPSDALLADLLAGDDLGARRQHLLRSSALTVSMSTPSSMRMSIDVPCVAGVEDLLRRAPGEGRDRRAAEPVGVAEPDEADDVARAGPVSITTVILSPTL